MEVGEVTVLLRQRTIEVVAQTGVDGQVGSDFEVVVDVSAHLVGTVVAVARAREVLAAGVGVAGQERGPVSEGEAGGVVVVVEDVELAMGPIAADADGVAS